MSQILFKAACKTIQSVNQSNDPEGNKPFQAFVRGKCEAIKILNTQCFNEECQFYHQSLFIWTVIIYLDSENE